MASSSRTASSSPSGSASWTTVGALVASATLRHARRLGGAGANPARPSRTSGVGRIVRQVEQSIGPWERPEDVLAAAAFGEHGLEGRSEA